MEPIKRMTPKEFRELGYLQEVNRRFLHPLGLALEMRVEDDGTEVFGQVWDYRNDPEGLVFAEGLIDPEKAMRIYRENVAKGGYRLKKNGFVIQPVSGETKLPGLP